MCNFKFHLQNYITLEIIAHLSNTKQKNISFLKHTPIKFKANVYSKYKAYTFSANTY